ncbi:MAG: two-component regulator propeller domain-containing protein [Acidobacteriota bacterium]
MIRSLRRAALLAALGVSVSAVRARASETRVWLSDSASDFSAGEARGVSVTGDGALALSRRIQPVTGIGEAAIYAAVEAKDGTIYLGTGDAGKVLRITGDRAETAVSLPEKEVTSLALGPDGALYAGASPGGKVYRISGGKADVFYQTGAKYVWALAFAGSGLYVATGLPGEIHRVVSPLKGERIHAATDPHVRSLFRDAQGRLWAGTAGSGLVMRIDPSGAISTVYDSSKTEISSITASADGRVWAAAVSAEAAPGGGEPITAPVTLPTGRAPHGPGGDDEGKEKAEVSVSVSSVRVAPSRPGSKGAYSSEVLVFSGDEPPRVVWSSSEELVFSLEPEADRSEVLAATGPNGKLYRIANGSWSLDRTLDEKQVTALAGDAIATNSSCAVYRLLGGPRQGQYISAVKDTGRTSRFGAFRWEGEIPPGAQAEFAFRSGESQVPDATWSSWSAWAAATQASRVAAPAARYLQWRVRMSSDGKALPVIRRTEAAYRNRNAAPDIDSLTAMAPAEVLARAVSGSTNVFETQAPDEKGIFTGLEESKAEGAPRKLLRKGYRTLTWKASDRDGDALSYELRVRPAGSDRWLLLRKDIKESFYAFDTTALPDGDYVFRLVASDADANPDDPKTATRDSSPVRIDNTPPTVRRLPDSGAALRFEATDEASPILEAEYSIDAKEWVRVEPDDGLSDSPAESYTIRLEGAPHGAYVLVRVTDAARNVVAASFVAP